MVHFIDDLDAKLNQFRSLDGGDGPQFLRGLGRYVYPDARLGQDTPPVEEPSGGADADEAADEAPDASDPQERLDL